MHVQVVSVVVVRLLGCAGEGPVRGFLWRGLTRGITGI